MQSNTKNYLGINAPQQKPASAGLAYNPQIGLGDYSFGTDGASSSENEDEENELPELGAEALNVFGPQTERQRKIVPDEKIKEKDAASWFEAGPFKYNGRLLLVALPGLMLVLSVGGDLLITALTIGTLIIYLLHIAGETQKSMMAYIGTFGCCQMIVIYSALPLLWHTIFNFFLIGLLNCFSVLTGAWGILFFDQFRAKEPDLTKLIESALFALYPAVNVILMTWMISGTVSPAMAPYGLLVIGFMVLQLFTTPTPSSFYKGDPRDTEKINVLDSATVGSMALVYAMLPPAVYTHLTIFTTFRNVLSFNFAVELLFLGSLSAFLATLMNVRQFLEIAGIEYRRMVQVRWVFGVLALFTLSGVLHKHGFSIYLLPWLSISVALHTGYGFLAGHRQYRTKSILVALLLLGLYTFVFTKLPWRLMYHLQASGLHITYLHLILFVNVVVCILCVYASVSARSEILGAIVLVQATVMVGAEKLLWAGDLYMTSTMMLSAIFSLYLYLRLYHAGKLPWQSTLVAISIHLMKTSDCCDAVLPKGMLRSDWTIVAYNDVSTFILALVLTKVILFENAPVSFNKWLLYMFVVIMALSLAMPGLIYKFFFIVLGHNPNFADLNSFGLLAASLVSIKLTLQGNLKYDWLGASHVGPTAMATAVLLLHLRPEAVFTWEEMNKWLVILNLMSCFMLIPAASLLKSPWILGLLATALGLPLGFAVASWVYPADTEIPYFFLYGLTTALLCCTGLFIWRQVPCLERKVFILFLLTVVCCLALLLEDFEHPDQDVFPGAIASMATILFTALILKLHSFRDKTLDLTVSGDVSIQRISLCGNLCTVMAYVLLCYMCPIQVWVVWYISSSVVLLMLQRDPYLLRNLSHSNSAAPLFYVSTVILWVAAQSTSTVLNSADMIPFLSGIIETIILWTSIPIYCIFFTVLWSGRFFLSDRLIVFLTPLSGFLLIFGSSYEATAVALYNIAIGIWLTNYALPLEPDYS